MKITDPHFISTRDAVCSRKLSAVDIKNSVFVDDSNFRQSWVDAWAELGERAFSRLQSTAMIIIKPEAFAGARGSRILDFVVSHGFQPVDWYWVQLSRIAINSVWQYQWNVATNDRLDLAKHLYCMDRALVVVLHDVQHEDRYPSAVRLRQLKGAAQVEKRRPEDMRSIIDSPNRTMSLVHASDEPIDIVRELGIVCEKEARRSLYRAMATDCYGEKCSVDKDHREVREIIRQEDLAKGNYDLSGNSTRAKISPATQRFIEQSLVMSGEVNGEPNIDSVLDYLRIHEPLLDAWERIIILSSFVTHDVAGRECLIDFDGVDHWKSGLGTMDI